MTSEESRLERHEIKNVTFYIIISLVIIGTILFMIYVFMPFANHISASFELPTEQRLADAEQNVINDMNEFNVYGQGFTMDEWDGKDCFNEPKKTYPDGQSGQRSICIDGYGEMIKQHEAQLKHVADLEKLAQ